MTQDLDGQLHPDHLQDLRGSGLTDATIHGAGIYSVPPADISKKLGFDAAAIRSMYGIPYLDAGGKILFVRYKLFPPLEGKDRTIKYFHPRGQPPIPYIRPEVLQAKDKHHPLWVTEGEKKALKLLQHGESAIAIAGVWNFKPASGSEGGEDIWASLTSFAWHDRLAYLAFDTDLSVNPSVRAALWELAFRLTAKGAFVKIIQWPGNEGKGIDDHLVHHEARGRSAQDTLTGLKDNAKTLQTFMGPDHEHAIARAFRLVKLPPLAYRSLLDRAAKVIGVKAAALAEVIASARLSEDSVMAVPENDKKRALQLLHNPQLVPEYLRACHAEYLGRENELLLLKLATVSRKFARGVSVILTGTSSVGKSRLVATVVKSVWEEDADDFTGISGRYLFYREKPLDHRVITFYELSGTEEAVHVVKTMISEGCLKLGTVIPDVNQGHVARDIKKSADGVVVISTTTSSVLDHELETRVIRVEIRHHQPLARQVYVDKALRLSGQTGSTPDDPGEGPDIQGKDCNGSPGHRNDPFYLWRVADHQLHSLDVVIPYGGRLAELFPTDEERFQRDFDKLLTLIQSSALLHQYQRSRDDRNRIIATRADYELVYRLRNLISQSVSQAPEHLVAFLGMVKQLTRAESGAMTYPRRNEVMEHLGVSDESMKRYVRACCGKDWLEVTGKGQKQVMRVLDVPHSISPIPHPDEIFGAPGGDRVTDVAKTETGQASAQVTPAATGDDRIEPGVGTCDTESDLDDYVRYAKELFAVSGKEQ